MVIAGEGWIGHPSITSVLHLNISCLSLASVLCQTEVKGTLVEEMKKGQDFGGDNYMKIYTDLYCRNGHDPVMPSLWPSYSHLTGIPAKKRVPATGSSPSVCGLSHDCQLYSQPGEFRGTVLFFCCRKSLLYL